MFAGRPGASGEQTPERPRWRSDNTGNNISLTTDCSHYSSFAGTNSICSAATTSLTPMSVLGEATDESFINLNDPAELIDIFHKRNADAMAHIPSGFQRTETHIAIDLPCAHALLTGEH